MAAFESDERASKDRRSRDVAVSAADFIDGSSSSESEDAAFLPD